MRPVGLAMIGIAIVMFVAARPRNGQVVPWLFNDSVEFAYAMMMIILLALGGAVALHG
jgi:hypothetical protein